MAFQEQHRLIERDGRTYAVYENEGDSCIGVEIVVAGKSIRSGVCLKGKVDDDELLKCAPLLREWMVEALLDELEKGLGVSLRDEVDMRTALAE